MLLVLLAASLTVEPKFFQSELLVKKSVNRGSTQKLEDAPIALVDHFNVVLWAV